jgi:hypothetical protein
LNGEGYSGLPQVRNAARNLIWVSGASDQLARRIRVERIDGEREGFQSGGGQTIRKSWGYWVLCCERRFQTRRHGIADNLRQIVPQKRLRSGKEKYRLLPIPQPPALESEGGSD